MKREGTITAIEAIRPVGEFGQVTEWVQRSQLHVLPQIRTTFDEIALQELADSIRLIEQEQATGNPRYDLLEPLTQGRHDEASARRYLRQYNQVNGTDLQLENYEPTYTTDGPRWYFHIAGERRLRAGDIIIERDALSPDSLFQCAIKENIEYIHALPLQFIENNARVNPPPADEARAIRRYSDAMKELAAAQGKRFTNVQCAQAFAVNPDKVTDAMTFTNYPIAMQKLAERYPFSTVIAAKDLYEAWCEYHQDTLETLDSSELEEFISTTGRAGFERIEDVAAFEVETCLLLAKAEKLHRRRDPGRPRRDMRPKKQAEQVRDSIMQRSLGITQEVLFADSEPAETYWARRKLASGSLFRASVEAIVLLDHLNMLSPEQRHRLGQIAAVEMLV